MEIEKMTLDEEENAVRQLCDLIGYERTLQIAQRLNRYAATDHPAPHAAPSAVPSPMKSGSVT